MQALCWFLGHHRSRRFATFNVSGKRWESYCTRCKVRLVRAHGGTWLPTDLNGDPIPSTVSIDTERQLAEQTSNAASICQYP